MISDNKDDNGELVISKKGRRGMQERAKEVHKPGIEDEDKSNANSMDTEQQRVVHVNS
jgi:replicative DNA helicase